MSEDEITEALLTFIRDNLLTESAQAPIDDTTPLLDHGILNSLKTAMLLNFARDTLGTFIPPEYLDLKNFRDVRSIAAMIHSLSDPAHA
jgi:acyl carrier protein